MIHLLCPSIFNIGLRFVGDEGFTDDAIDKGECLFDSCELCPVLSVASKNEEFESFSLSVFNGKSRVCSYFLLIVWE